MRRTGIGFLTVLLMINYCFTLGNVSYGQDKGQEEAYASGSPACDQAVVFHMDSNSRKNSVYDGFSQGYVEGEWIKEGDTFHITSGRCQVDLADVKLDYYMQSYGAEGTQIYHERTVFGVDEETHYPVIWPETIEREKEKGTLYDAVNRCFTVTVSYQDQEKTYYFSVLSPQNVERYENLLVGTWQNDSKGSRYLYKGKYLTSWAKIEGQWYLFGDDGYKKSGWQEFKDQWYYLDPETGVLQSDSLNPDGHYLDADGNRVDFKQQK